MKRDEGIRISGNQAIRHMRLTLCLVTYVLCLLFFPFTAQAATYYLDAVNGNDANPGTSDSTWQTLNRVYKSYSGSGPKVQAGDTVLFRNGSYGSYYEEQVDRSDWVTYRAADGCTPELTSIGTNDQNKIYNTYLIFDGFTIRAPVATKNETSAIVIRNSAHVKFLNLNVIGQSTQYATYGIRAWGDYGTSDITIDHCKLYGAGPGRVDGFTSGIKLNEGNISDINITNNEIKQISTVGIYVKCVKGTISNNEIHYTGADACIGVASGTGPLLIENNRVHDLQVYQPTLNETPASTVWSADGKTMTNPNARWNTPGVNMVTTDMEIQPISGTNVFIGDGEATGGNFQVASVSPDGTQITLSRGISSGGQPSNVNYFIKMATHTDLLQVYDVPGSEVTSNLTIRGNQFYDCSNPDRPTSDDQFFNIDPQSSTEANGIGGYNFIIENNLFWNSYVNDEDESDSTLNIKHVDGVIFRNNTLIGKLYIPNAENAVVRGNIISMVSIASANAVDSDYNIYNRGTFSSPSVVGSHDTFLHGHGDNYYWDKWNDPVFTGIFTSYANGDFSLASSNSLAVGHGDPTNYPTTDILGNTRDSHPDAGCYEYGAGASIIYGDVSGDGQITAYDAALTAQAVVGSVTLTADQKKAADVSGDGQVTAYDAALIAQKAVGLITKFPVEG